MVNILDDVETPGKMRKVGPSLRHVASKVDFDFLYSWIRKPSDFRPSTKMPQFFGLWNHLGGKGWMSPQQFEPMEIRGAVEYLLAKSQPFEYASSPTERSKAPPSAASSPSRRAAWRAIEHNDFPQGKMTQGPDLSRIGAKLARTGNPNGRSGSTPGSAIPASITPAR